MWNRLTTLCDFAWRGQQQGNIRMSKHTVSLINLGKIDLPKGAEMEIREDGKLLGNLEIGNAGIEWLPARHSKNMYRISWKDFAVLLEENVNKSLICN